MLEILQILLYNLLNCQKPYNLVTLLKRIQILLQNDLKFYSIFSITLVNKTFIYCVKMTTIMHIYFRVNL